MELFVTIAQVFPLAERNYTDRNGAQQVFASRGMILDNGLDRFYAEAIGDYARSLQVQAGESHMVSLQLNARTFTDKNGVTRYDNEIRVNRIG